MKKEINLAILASDLHISKDNIQESKKSLLQIQEAAIELQIPIILLGDIFDSRISQPLITLKTFQYFIDSCQENDVEVIAISGNHDKTDLEDEYSYISVVSGINYKTHEKECLVESESALFGFLPYFPERGSYIKRLKNLNQKLRKQKSKKVAYLFTHIGVNEVKNNDGSLLKNDIKTDLFEDYDLVFIGHYHNKSLIGENIVYMGSDRPKNYGEDNDKGILVLTNQGFHEINTDFKKYYKFDFEIPEETIKLEKLKDKYTNSKHNVRFNLKGREDHLSTYKKSDFSAIGIDLKKTTDRLQKSIKEAEKEDVINFDNKTITLSFIKFAKEFKMKSSTRKSAIKLLKDVHTN